MDGQPPDPASRWTQYAGIGFNFSAAVAGFSLVGYWIDHHYKTSPWGVLIGLGLGLTGGTYNLIRASMAAFRQCERDRRSRPKKNTQDKLE